MLQRLMDVLIRACHTVAAQFLPPSPVAHVPDVPSPLYPDRPIRPLPKRRLRSRLSPDRSQSVLYSPSAQEPSSLFYYPYPYSEVDPPENTFRTTTSTNTTTADHHPNCLCANPAESVPAEGEIESEEDELAPRTRPAPSSQPQQQQESVSQLFDQPRSPVKPPESTASSVDGYDSFENTKNKKKRKIPTPSGVGVHQAHLSADLANLEISSRNGSEPASSEDLTGTIGASGTTPPASVVSPHRSALSGSGSGRLSRPTWRGGSLKSPLGVSSDGLNVWANGRERVRAKDLATTANGAVTPGSPSLRRPLEAVPAEVSGGGGGGHPAKKRDPGIIAAAIARAKATPNSPHVEAKDQENVSWFMPNNNTRKQAPQNTQFTFTAASNVAWPGDMAWPSGAGSGENGRPGQLAPPAPPMMAALGKSKPAPTQLSREMSTQGTQTSPNVGGVRRSPQTGQVPTYAKTSTKQGPVPNHHQPLGPPPAQTMPQPPRPQQQSSAQQQQASAQQPQPANAGSGAAAAQPAKKTRPRRPGSQYAVAARERRLQQQYKNYHHPPAGDEIWICEFCEYESIFGVQPEALVRQYEIKDLKERRRLAEKRRLLEKAKMKGRKGKKASKNAAKAANNNNAATGAAAGAATGPITTNNQQTQTPMTHLQQQQQVPVDQDPVFGPANDYLQEEFFDGEEEDDEEEEDDDDDEAPILSQLRPPPASTTTQTANAKTSTKPKYTPSRYVPTGGSRVGAGGEAVRAN